MSRAEYTEINPRLDQERRVLLPYRLYNRTFQVLAVYDPRTPENSLKMERYPSADYEKVLEKFHAGFPKSEKTDFIIPVHLSVDEQNYLLEMYSERIRQAISENDMNLAHNLLFYEEKFKLRCDISNTQILLPANVFKLGPHGIPDSINSDTD